MGGRAQDRRPGAKVSVVTVTRNAEQTLARTIASVADQSYASIEYIVVDGASTDGTVDILRARSADIDLWISEPDAGISDAFNKGVALACGEYLILVNADDWLSPHHIALALDGLSRSGADFVFGDLVLHAGDGTVDHLLCGDQRYRERIRHVMPFINHPTVVCRANMFERYGLFDTSYRFAMDYEWILRCHCAGAIGAYVQGLQSHMSLQGVSERAFNGGLAEVRRASVRHGYPSALAWARFCFRVAKGTTRRTLRRLLPQRAYETMRSAVNPNFRPLR